MGSKRRSERQFTSMGWSKEELDLLGDLWMKGKTGREISDDLNSKFGTNRTRNAVLAARTHHLHTLKRETLNMKKAKRVPNFKPITKQKYYEIKLKNNRAYGDKVHLLDINHMRCKYPLGSGMCCNAKEYAHEMCYRHYKICYVEIDKNGKKISK